MTRVADSGRQWSPLTGNCGKQASQSNHRGAMKYQARLTLGSLACVSGWRKGFTRGQRCGITARSE
jgi:hypothetical protein